jgi:hypothetical protein
MWRLKLHWLLQVALAQCVGDAECLENLICLQLCNGKEDETACQASPLPWLSALL